MNRSAGVEKLSDRSLTWDVIIVGGGATGLAAAVESASRGYRTLLVEQSDFAKGTSGRSTKLIHGGVRYLRQGNISLVLEALRERGYLIRNAPHLVHNLEFVVPAYDWWQGPFYGAGLKVYDMLAGKLGLGPSRLLTREETLSRLPTLEPGGLRGGVVYHDGQFDDARLACTLALTADDLGATVLNYVQVTSLVKTGDLVSGAVLLDIESGREFQVSARVVVNATGVFADAVRRLDDPECEAVISASQGIHIVLDRSFMPGSSAIMVPQTDDGRVLFAVPWHSRVIVGTTDTPVSEVTIEPRALDDELEFLFAHAARYLTRDPGPADVLSVFAGLRPLVRSVAAVRTAALSRDHTLLVSGSGLVTITGGKWTTCRKMGEDAINQAAIVGGLEDRSSTTRTLRLHGWTESPEQGLPFQVYGAEAQRLRRLGETDPGLLEPLHPRLPYVKAEVIWGVRNEMARTVEDVLARRTRSLLLDARAAIESAGVVARLMARELGGSAEWESRQAVDFIALAKRYLP